MERLQEIFVDLPERDQELVQQGPHLGIVMNEYQETFEMGDFLISNVVGVDKESGAVAIGNRVRVGQTVRFHVRDASDRTRRVTRSFDSIRREFRRCPPSSPTVQLQRPRHAVIPGSEPRRRLDSKATEYGTADRFFRPGGTRPRSAKQTTFTDTPRASQSSAISDPI